VTPTIFGIRSNISLKLLELETSNLTHGFVYGQCRAGAQINFPESGHGLGHVTPTIFGTTVGYPSDSLASCSVKWRDLMHVSVLTKKLNPPDGDIRSCPLWLVSAKTAKKIIVEIS